MSDPTAVQFAAAQMARIQRYLRWIAILVPLALFALISVDGISLSDIAVTGFVAVILWLFALLAGFTADAIRRAGERQE